MTLDLHLFEINYLLEINVLFLKDIECAADEMCEMVMTPCASPANCHAVPVCTGKANRTSFIGHVVAIRSIVYLALLFELLVCQFNVLLRVIQRSVVMCYVNIDRASCPLSRVHS